MSRRGINKEVAASIPVDDSTLPYSATNAQEAFENSIGVGGVSRLPSQFGYNGNANTNRWLELFQNVASNTSPFVFAEDGELRTFSVAVRSATTVTFTVFINGISVGTLSLVGTDVGSISVSGAVIANDELSVQVTSGSCQDPIFIVTTRVVA